ncbi:MAG TPA: diguanylate cyclase [Spirochaetia bacterium]|nr:diguanylate cyclase [Spirochaetia bacterium]
MKNGNRLAGEAGAALTPRNLRWFVPLVFTAVAGLTLTIVVFAAFTTAERSRIFIEFQNVAADRAQAIRAELSEDTTELDLLAGYLNASTELSEERLNAFAQEFGRFVRRIPAAEPDTQAVALISRVTAAERSMFEEFGRKQLAPGFIITELGPGGEPRPASKRSVYYPVTIIEPLEHTMPLVGLDLQSIPPLKSALDHALASGRITTSVAVKTPASLSQKPVIWMFLPVYRTPASAGSPAARGELIGVAALACRVDLMIDYSLRDVAPAGIDLELIDSQAPAAQQTLYFRKAKVPGFDVSPSVHNWLAWSTTLDAGERTWTLRAYPTSEFMIRHRTWQSWIILAGGILITALASLYFAGGLRRTARVESLVTERTRELAEEVAKHEELEKALAQSQSTLAGQVERLRLRNREVQLLNEVGDQLQACISTDEAYPIIRQHLPMLLAGASGALYIHDPDKNLFSSMAEWGDDPPATGAFVAEDCWALRRGKIYAVSEASAALPCRHSSADLRDGSLCVPIAASGRTIGLFHAVGCAEEAHPFAVSVAEHIGLALSNLMLRSDLRQLSIRDPLTGLFNRRYMEEALEIEIRRAERKEHSIGIIMLDIDHFKSFNDRFGHAAGDELLQALGALIRTSMRASDIACRYGGEEFVLILPEASEAAARQRAEELRQRTHRMEVKHLDTVLGPVSISLGVGLYPDHGRSRDLLLGAADSALYQAKEGGRDRVVVAETAGG